MNRLTCLNFIFFGFFLGMDIAPLDLMNIERFAKKVVSLADYRKELAEYLRSKMDSVAPNLASLIGDTVSIRSYICMKLLLATICDLVALFYISIVDVNIIFLSSQDGLKYNSHVHLSQRIPNHGTRIV